MAPNNLLGLRRQVARFALGAVTAVAFLLAGVNGPRMDAAFAQAFELKISHAATPHDPINIMLEKFKEQVEAEAGDRLNVQIFHSGQLAGQREGVEGLQFGTIEIVVIPNGIAAGFDPTFMLMDIPFQFDDLEHARRMIDEFGEELLFADTESVDLFPLALWEQGFRNLGTAKRPVANLDDLQDLKIRTMEAPLHVTAWRALGANPTPMGWAQVMPSLQQGVVEGVEVPSHLFTNTGVYEVLEHVILTHHIYDPLIVLGSKLRFDAMPQDLRDLVRNTMLELTAEQRKINQADIDEAERKLPELGVTVSNLTPEQAAAFREASQPPVLAEVRDTLGDEKVDAWLAAVDATRE